MAMRKKSSSSDPIFDLALAKATVIPASTIKAYVDAVRRKNPNASPEQVIKILASQYKALMRTTGGAVGVSAALPGIGTTTALILSAADVGAFLFSASLFSLAIADVHGIEVTDVERRKALLLTSVLGDTGAKTVRDVTGKPAMLWGTTLLTSLPKSTIKQVNGVLASRFIKRQLIKYTGLTVGRIVPFGVGAVVGIVGGNGLAATVISQTNKAFGPAPASFSRPIITVIEQDTASEDPVSMGSFSS